MSKPINRMKSFLLGVSLLAGACASDAEHGTPDTHASERPVSRASGSLPQVETDGVVRNHRVALTELKPALTTDFQPKALCKFVRHPGYHGHGLYEVTALTAYLERVGNEEIPATYVELTRLKNFHDADEKIVARIGGGPLRNGDVAAWNLALELHEPVVVLGVVKPGAWNLGYPALDPTHVFRRRAGGGYTNGALFTKRVIEAEEMGELVAGLAGEPMDQACPYDVEPDVSVNSEPEVRPEAEPVSGGDVPVGSDERGRPR